MILMRSRDSQDEGEDEEEHQEDEEELLELEPRIGSCRVREAADELSVGGVEEAPASNTVVGGQGLQRMEGHE